MRHAKSSWDDPSLEDYARPLKKKGRRRAAEMARMLAGNGLSPAAILSSTTERARQTAEIVFKQFPKADLQYYDELYQSSVDRYLQILSRIEKKFIRSTLMLIGHNPEIEDFVRIVCGSSENIKTATIAQLHFDIPSWPDLRDKPKGKVVAVWRPIQQREISRPNN